MSVLEGRRVLLVEDESLVAMMVEDMLLDFGCEVVMAMRLDKAVALARTGTFDVAVLDVNLGEGRSYPIADILFERCTPFLFATGYGLKGLETAYRGVPVLQKPYQAEPLQHLLRGLLTGEIVAHRDALCLPGACRCRVGDPGSRSPDPSPPS